MMRASGTVYAPLALLIFAIAAIEVPFAIVLSREIGLDGVWMAYPAAFGSMFVLQMSYYMLVWRRRAVKRLI
jgi:Na+-driven multidrug efflux pump